MSIALRLSTSASSMQSSDRVLLCPPVDNDHPLGEREARLGEETWLPDRLGCFACWAKPRDSIGYIFPFSFSQCCVATNNKNACSTSVLTCLVQVLFAASSLWCHRKASVLPNMIGPVWINDISTTLRSSRLNFTARAYYTCAIYAYLGKQRACKQNINLIRNIYFSNLSMFSQLFHLLLLSMFSQLFHLLRWMNTPRVPPARSILLTIVSAVMGRVI